VQHLLRVVARPAVRLISVRSNEAAIHDPPNVLDFSILLLVPPEICHLVSSATSSRRDSLIPLPVPRFLLPAPRAAPKLVMDSTASAGGQIPIPDPRFDTLK
jgi:hypothetical protein